MPPYKKYPGRRYPNDPFDFFAGDFDPFDMDQFFNKMINEMHRSRSSISFEEMIEEVFRDKNGKKNRVVHGFCIEIRPDGKMRVHEFGKHPSSRRRPLNIKEHKPTSDIVEGKDEIAVTVDIPGVEREDIDLNVTEDSLEITVDNPKRRYHKLFDLPCSVKPKTIKSTYKNGVLDIIVKKKIAKPSIQ